MQAVEGLGVMHDGSMVPAQAPGVCTQMRAVSFVVSYMQAIFIFNASPQMPHKSGEDMCTSKLMDKAGRGGV